MTKAAIDLAMSSVTESTLRQYQAPLKKWNFYCSERNIDPLETNFIEIQNFLTTVFASGASYGTINSYRSALALILGPEIAQDTGVKRICKAASKLRPPVSKYNITWDPKIVLNFLSTWAPNDQISLKNLSYKLITLFGLVTAHRLQTFSLIEINNIYVLKDKIQIKIPAQIKTSGPKRKQPVLNLPFYPKTEIYPAHALLKYL